MLFCASITAMPSALCSINARKRRSLCCASMRRPDRRAAFCPMRLRIRCVAHDLADGLRVRSIGSSSGHGRPSSHFRRCAVGPSVLDCSILLARQRESECRSAARPRSRPYFTVMSHDNALHDGKADPGPGIFLQCMQSLEYAEQRTDEPAVEAHTVIHHFVNDPCRLLPSRDRNLRLIRPCCCT